MQGGGGPTQETKNVEINIGGIEIGDQTMDLSTMSRTDLRNLAEMISEEIGQKVSIQ
jgi:hypothetical protein